MNSYAKRAILAGVTSAMVFTIAPFADYKQILGKEDFEDPLSIPERVALVQDSSLLPVAPTKAPDRVLREVNVVVTAYSSTPDQTDDTPFITASGNWVRDGIVATNILPMGTKIKIPDLYGNRVFVVDDRMHPRKQYQVDIWFSTYWEAKSFGVKNATIEVLER